MSIIQLYVYYGTVASVCPFQRHAGEPEHLSISAACPMSTAQHGHHERQSCHHRWRAVKATSELISIAAGTGTAQDTSKQNAVHRLEQHDDALEGQKLVNLSPQQPGHLRRSRLVGATRLEKLRRVG